MSQGWTSGTEFRIDAAAYEWDTGERYTPLHSSDAVNFLRQSKVKGAAIWYIRPKGWFSKLVWRWINWDYRPLSTISSGGDEPLFPKDALVIFDHASKN